MIIEKVKEIMEQYRPIKKSVHKNTETPFLKISHEEFTLNNGATLKRDILVKKNRGASIIIPETTDHKYVMVIQPRPCSEFGVSIEFPAGYVENREKIEAAMKRELEEETGYVTNKIRHISSVYQDIGCSKSQIHLFHAQNCRLEKEQKLDHDELITFITVTYDELLELYNHQMITDINTLSCLFYLMNENNKKNEN